MPRARGPAASGSGGTAPGERVIRRRFLFLTAVRWLPGGLVLPVLVLLMQSRGLVLSEVGTLLAGFAILTALCELPTGGLADVVGHKPILLASSVLTIAAFVLLATAGRVGTFALALAVFAVGRALSSGPLQSWYVDSVHAIEPASDLRVALSQEGLVSSLAIGTGAVLGGVIPDLSQRLAPALPTEGSAVFTSLTLPVWLAAGLLCVATAAIAALMTHSPTRGGTSSLRADIAEAGRRVRGGVGLAARDHGIRAILLAVAAVGFAISATELLAPAFVEHLTGSAERATALYGILVTTSFLASGLGSAGAPIISRLTRGSMRGAALACLLGAAAYTALGVSAAISVVVISYLSVYLALGAADPLRIEQLHHRVTSKQRTTMLSVESMAMMAGGSIGSLTVGRLAEQYGYAAGWFSCVTALVIAAAISLAVRDRPRHAAAAVAAESEPVAP
jgi:predicted MFS family arabinose efflux permease